MLYTTDLSLAPEQVEDIQFFAKECSLATVPEYAQDVLDCIVNYKLRTQTAVKNGDLNTVAKLQDVLSKIQKGKELEELIRDAIIYDNERIQDLRDTILSY